VDHTGGVQLVGKRAIPSPGGEGLHIITRGSMTTQVGKIPERGGFPIRCPPLMGGEGREKLSDIGEVRRKGGASGGHAIIKFVFMGKGGGGQCTGLNIVGGKTRSTKQNPNLSSTKKKEGRAVEETLGVGGGKKPPASFRQTH